MKFVYALAALAGVVSAQSTACAAEAILENCLATEQALVNSCAATDYTCLCAAYQALNTCFNNCPNDPRASSAGNQQTIYCQYASQFSSKTSSAVSAATATGSTAPSASASTTSANAKGSSTASGSAASPSKTGAAGEVAMNAGSLLLAVAGVVVAVL